MPFRDRDWEDLQRDCDLFPAYTDYIFGLDTRPEVADEPGLHPQIYDPSQSRPQRLFGFAQQTEYYAAHDLVRDAARASPYTMLSSEPTEMMTQNSAAVSPTVTRELFQMYPTQQPTFLLRHESTLDPRLLTPTPSPRILPATVPPIALLRPGELATDPVYSFIPQQERMAANKNIIKAWGIINSDAIPVQRASATNYLNDISRMVASDRQEYQNHVSIRLEAQKLEAERDAELQRIQQQDHGYYDRFGQWDSLQADVDTEPQTEWEEGLASHAYAVSDISQLSSYVQPRLPQLWTCTQIIALKAQHINQNQLDVHRQAQQYLMTLKQSVPPNGRPWVDLLVTRMLQLNKQGEDPLMVLETMPDVEKVYVPQS